jgi:hypothetical protein
MINVGHRPKQRRVAATLAKGRLMEPSSDAFPATFQLAAAA